MIHTGEPNISEKEIRSILNVLRANQLSWKGPAILAFERKFAKYCGVRYAAVVNSGSSSLLLAILALDLPRGSEVIVPDFGYIAVPNVVRQAGLRPVFVDVEPDTGNIDPEKITAKVTRKTRAIICIHIYGHVCDMGQINRIAKKHRLYVIEDAAQAHGSEYRGRKAGSLGDIGCFSFAGNKLITTGEGGVIVSNNPKLYRRFAWAREQFHFVKGRERYWHAAVGYGFYMSSLQAALGLAQLSRIRELIAAKRRNAAFYKRELSRINRGFGAELTLPVEKKYARNTFWMYGIQTRTGKERDGLMDFLEKRGVETRNFFPAFHTQPAFRQKGSFPQSERLARTGLYLPSGTGLTEKELRRVTTAIREFYRRRHA